MKFHPEKLSRAARSVIDEAVWLAVGRSLDTTGCMVPPTPEAEALHQLHIADGVHSAIRTMVALGEWSTRMGAQLPAILNDAQATLIIAHIASPGPGIICAKRCDGVLHGADIAMTYIESRTVALRNDPEFQAGVETYTASRFADVARRAQLVADTVGESTSEALKEHFLGDDADFGMN